MTSWYRDNIITGATGLYFLCTISDIEKNETDNTVGVELKKCH